MPARSNSPKSPIQPDEMADGQWYFGFDCGYCGKRFAIEEDRSFGTRTRPDVGVIGAGLIITECPFAGANPNIHRKT